MEILFFFTHFFGDFLFQLQIQERDKQIGEKERKIYELKKRSQELEKFKFVLDHKIKELKRDIGPREDEIQRMKAVRNKQTRYTLITPLQESLKL